jgi:hypothetical protein
MCRVQPVRAGGAPAARLARELLLVAAGGAVAILLRTFDLSGMDIVPPCPFHALTGICCPGCGSLRALHQALNGDLGAALGLNLLAVLAVPLIGYHVLARALAAVSNRAVASPLEHAYSSRVALAAVLAFWVMRNVPHYPFNLLAP